ncbi:nuclear receptor subfamily 0 group B member 2-like isoform X2 [Branchiostoma floridae]|nr:nuclear receptor subfamily 0 group B member 2-like isoform X2 [Branchiostoma floridae]
MADQLNEMTGTCDRCPPKSLSPEKSILYNLLITPATSDIPPSIPHAPPNNNPVDDPGMDPCCDHGLLCSCGCCSHVSPTAVTLRNPSFAHQQACQVLLRTLTFVKNLPTFGDLCPHDRALLLTSGWSDLFTVGLAQSRVQFNTEPAGGDRAQFNSEPTGYDRVQFNTEPTRGNRVQFHTEPTGGDRVSRCESQIFVRLRASVDGVPTEMEVAKIQNFVERCQVLDLDMKEHSYLMAALLFNPDVPGLVDGRQVEILQNSAHQSLNEYTTARYPLQPLRFARILLGLPALRSIKPKIVTELFFRPLIGAIDMEVILTDMLLKGC